MSLTAQKGRGGGHHRLATVEDVTLLRGGGEHALAPETVYLGHGVAQNVAVKLVMGKKTLQGQKCQWRSPMRVYSHANGSVRLYLATAVLSAQC